MSITYGTKTNLLLAKAIPSGLIFAQWLKYEGHFGLLQGRLQQSRSYRNKDYLSELGILAPIICRDLAF